MKRTHIVAVLFFGLALAATGCGGSVGPVEAEATGSMAQGAVCLDCDGGGGTGGNSTNTYTMDLATFQYHAYASSPNRCDIPWNECRQELDYALSKNLITREAYDWGYVEGYYPVVDRYDTIKAVCGCY